MNRWKDWTAEENARLAQMFRVGLSDTEMGRVLGRTAQAIAMRRKRLGLRHVGGQMDELRAYRGRELTHRVTETGVQCLRTGRQWRVRYAECREAARDLHGPALGLPPATLEREGAWL